MRKATAFRGGANKTVPPCETLTVNKYLVTVPGEQLQRKHSIKNSAFRKINCVRFGRVASLSAFVLFAGGCLFLHYFSIFLRFQFVRSFYVFGMANSCLLLLDFNTISSKPLLRRAACPPFLKDALPFCPFGTFPHTVGNHPPRRAEPARPQLPAARILQPLSISPIFRQFAQLKLSIHQIKCLFFCLFHNLCKRWL